MKKTVSEQELADDIAEMRPEYDFRDAVRGRAYRPLHEGYEIRVHKEDGTTVIQQFKLEAGTVMLEPDVRAYFPDSDAVNKALRTLITLFPTSRETAKRKTPAARPHAQIAAERGTKSRVRKV